MLRRIAHVGVAVRALEPAVPFYRDVLGLPFGGVEEVPGYAVRVAFFDVGESRIELLEPITGRGMIAEFLRTHGPGMHHVAYEVEDLEAAMRACAASGAELLDRSPRPGAHGARVAFLRASPGQPVLTELCQFSTGRERKAS